MLLTVVRRPCQKPVLFSHDALSTYESIAVDATIYLQFRTTENIALIETIRVITAY